MLENELAPSSKATKMAFNNPFSLISVGTSWCVGVPSPDCTSPAYAYLTLQFLLY